MNVVNVVNVARGYRPGISFCNLNDAQYLQALAAIPARDAYRKHLSFCEKQFDRRAAASPLGTGISCASGGAECEGDVAGASEDSLSTACRKFLEDSPPAPLQWRLEGDANQPAAGILPLARLE